MSSRVPDPRESGDSDNDAADVKQCRDSERRRKLAATPARSPAGSTRTSTATQRRSDGQLWERRAGPAAPDIVVGDSSALAECLTATPRGTYERFSSGCRGAAAFDQRPIVAWTGEILRQHRDSTEIPFSGLFAQLASVTMRFRLAKRGETPRVGLEPTTRYRAGRSSPHKQLRASEDRPAPVEACPEQPSCCAVAVVLASVSARAGRGQAAAFGSRPARSFGG